MAEDAITYEGTDLEALAAMPNYYRWIMETFAPHVRGNAVEYGAGIGTVSALLAPLVETLTLVEMSPNLVVRLRERFNGTSNVSIVDAPLETHARALASRSIDTIVLVNVLEHIDDDRSALRYLIEALRPGGHLLLFVPALPILMSKLDRMLGHFRRYHKKELEEKVMSAGARVESCRYLDLIGVLPWLILNCFLGFTTFNPVLVELNDQYGVRLSRMLEQTVAAPFGKNLILVARKI